MPTIVIGARLAREDGLQEFARLGFRTDDSVGRHAIPQIISSGTAGAPSRTTANFKQHDMADSPVLLETVPDDPGAGSRLRG